jgi:hypothetical protein
LKQLPLLKALLDQLFWGGGLDQVNHTSVSLIKGIKSASVMHKRIACTPSL